MLKGPDKAALVIKYAPSQTAMPARGPIIIPPASATAAAGQIAEAALRATEKSQPSRALV
jgi:hypothetical protein